MTTRRNTILAAALTAAALGLGACAVRYAEVGGDEPYTDVYAEAETVYPQRVHYREPADTVNVYYYEESRPDVVVERPIFREQSGRTYYVEREHGADRRYYYDDRKAAARRPQKGGRQDDGRGHDHR